MAAQVLVTAHVYGDGVAARLQEVGHEVIRGEPVGDGPPQPIIGPERFTELGNVRVIVVSHRDTCPAEVIDAAPRLRAVVSTVTGVDTIAVDHASARGLLVVNGAMPENYLGVAEATVMLIAALLLDLPGKQRVLRGERPPPRAMLGRMVGGKRIGLVGMGRSAQGVVDRLGGWDVTIQAHDPFVQQFPEPVAPVATLDALLEASDVVSLHVTLSPATHHLIDERALRRMRSDAYRINTSRGGVVDEEALARALKDGWIAGAALDVFEQEPLPDDSPLRSLPNVILTPHMIGHSRELFAAIPRTAADSVLRILAGEVPAYVVNPGVAAGWQDRFA